MTCIIRASIKEAGGNNRAVAEVLFSLATAEDDYNQYPEAGRIEPDDTDEEKDDQILFQEYKEADYSDDISLQNSLEALLSSSDMLRENSDDPVDDL